MSNKGLSEASLLTASKIRTNGEVEETDQYVLYSFGAESKKQAISQDAIEALKTYLSQAPKDRPLFILSHFPLHSAKDRDASSYGDTVISVLNEASEEGCDIVFLWGHNHTIAGSGEDHYDCVYTDNLDGKEIKFLYAAAGCMSDVGGVVNGKGLVAKIENRKISSLVYYDVNATQVGSGYENPQ